ncbi:MAG: argininosuccinate synthase [Ktedonobacterales bacterium]
MTTASPSSHATPDMTNTAGTADTVAHGSSSPLLHAALAKLAATEVPQGQQIALAYSGGLDSALCVVLAREKYHAAALHAITVDVGQGEDEITLSRQKAAQLGLEPIMLDAREEFATEWLTKAIRANSDYGGYPVSTSMTRQLIAAKVAQLGLSLGANALMEGSSGKGNDQYRMHNVFTLFAPACDVLVPVRDFDLTRTEELELCTHFGVPVTEIIVGGDDKTLWCRSIASGGIGLDTELPDSVWLWLVPPTKAPETPTRVSVTFESGLPVALNGEVLPLADLIGQLNVLAGANGIGKINIFEDGIMGLKSREIYEAPAATVILKLHRDLEQFCLTKEELRTKRVLEAEWASMVYHGEWFHPLKAAIDAFIAQTQSVVSGTYTVDLYKGTVDIISRQSQTSLFFPEVRSISSTSFNQQMCGPAAQIRGLPHQLLAKRAIKAGLAVGGGATPAAAAPAQGIPDGQGQA